MKAIYTALLALTLSACGGEGRSTDKKVDTFSDEKVSGLIAGEPWAYKSGRVRPSFTNDGTYGLELWEAEYEDPCAVFMPDSDRKVIGTIPLEAGSYSVGLLADVSYTLVDIREPGRSMN